MNLKPKVSILIPCYNAERWISEAIESALCQNYQNKEVIIVDDGSTDGSLNIIKSFGDRIQWETQANQGGNAARNRLLELSTGEWLQYLDADDYLLPNKINQQIQFLHHDSQTEVIYSPHITEEQGENGEFVLNSPAIADLPLPHDLWLLAIQWKLPQTGGLLIRKQALIDIQGWRKDLKHCQDYDLYVRLLIANKKFSYCDQSGAVYRWWCSGTVTSRKIAEIYQDRLGIQDTIENYLSITNQLTPLRQNAINQARFEYARRIYTWNSQWANQVALDIKKKYPSFAPSPEVAPIFYRQLYRIIGFNGAESVALFKRKILK